MGKNIFAKLLNIGKAAANIASVAGIADSISDLADSSEELQDMGASMSMPEGADGLSEIQKLELESKLSAAENKEKITEFLNNAYGRDMSDYVDSL